MDIKGLTDKEVKESRAKFGSNEIPDSEPTTFWQEFKETFTNNYLEKSINTTHHLSCQMEKEHSKQENFRMYCRNIMKDYISYHRF